jgi:hypothetical protein
MTAGLTDAIVRLSLIEAQFVFASESSNTRTTHSEAGDHNGRARAKSHPGARLTDHFDLSGDFGGFR